MKYQALNIKEGIVSYCHKYYNRQDEISGMFSGGFLFGYLTKTISTFYGFFKKAVECFALPYVGLVYQRGRNIAHGVELSTLVAGEGKRHLWYAKGGENEAESQKQ